MDVLLLCVRGCAGLRAGVSGLRLCMLGEQGVGRVILGVEQSVYGLRKDIKKRPRTGEAAFL